MLMITDFHSNAVVFSFSLSNCWRSGTDRDKSMDQVGLVHQKKPRTFTTLDIRRTFERVRIGKSGHLQTFPASVRLFLKCELPDSIIGVRKKSPFGTAGYAWVRALRKMGPEFQDHGKPFPSEEPRTIRDIMVQKGEPDYDESYEVDKAELKKWKYEKGEKRIPYS